MKTTRRLSLVQYRDSASMIWPVFNSTSPHVVSLNVCPQSFARSEVARFLRAFGADWLTTLVASYFRREEGVLLAFLQILPPRAEQKRNSNTWWTVRQILVWKKRTAQKGEMRGKVPLMILNQTQPFPVPRARAALRSPYMVMVFAWRETLGLWIGTSIEIPLY